MTLLNVQTPVTRPNTAIVRLIRGSKPLLIGHGTCEADEFNCTTNICLPNSFKCSGEVFRCSTYRYLIEYSECETCSGLVQQCDYYGRKRCLPISNVCDGKPDCSNHRDEHVSVNLVCSIVVCVSSSTAIRRLATVQVNAVWRKMWLMICTMVIDWKVHSNGKGFGVGKRLTMQLVECWFCWTAKNRLNIDFIHVLLKATQLPFSSYMQKMVGYQSTVQCTDGKHYSPIYACSGNPFNLLQSRIHPRKPLSMRWSMSCLHASSLLLQKRQEVYHQRQGLQRSQRLQRWPWRKELQWITCLWPAQ